MKSRKIASIMLSIVLCSVCITSNSVLAATQNPLKANNISIDFSSEVERIQSNKDYTDEMKIKYLIEKMFIMKSENDKIDENLDFNIFMDNTKLSNSQILFNDKIKLLKNIRKQYNLKITWDKVELEVNDLVINGDHAHAKIREIYSYKENNSKSISQTGYRYDIDLIKTNNKWLIIEIISDDNFDKNNIGKEINIDDALKNIQKYEKHINYDTADIQNKILDTEKMVKNAGGTVHPYDRHAAMIYAISYAINYNPRFGVYNGVDCQNFGSQCVWYGFGGEATNQTAINSKWLPMIDLGKYNSRSWYQTDTTNDTPTNWS